jgi:predicted MFS family arabinose efflux permease
MGLCIGLFSLGETITFSAAEMHVAGIAGVQAAGSYFGAFQVAIALGGTLGAYAGSALMGVPGHRCLPWLTYAGLCLILVLVLARIKQGAPGSTPEGRSS